MGIRDLPEGCDNPADINEQEITRLLSEYQTDDREAVHKLIPLVYDRLRAMAEARFRHEAADHTLQPTALIHEVYLQLLDQQSLVFRSRGEFFAFAGAVMRNVLTKYARDRNAAKRGGGKVFAGHDEALDVAPEDGLDLDTILALDRALAQLAETFPRKCKIVQLRYFAGLTLDEVAEVMHLSKATVKREWQTARLWISRAM